MYQYEYIDLELEIKSWGQIHGLQYGSDDIKEVINQMAEQGWRFVTYIPIKTSSDGALRKITLVFEMLVEEE